MNMNPYESIYHIQYLVTSAKFLSNFPQIPLIRGMPD